jgi:hypothetical protein
MAPVQHKAAFTEAEETQLKALFSLDSEGLDTILQGCAYVFEQCAYVGANEAMLAAQLTDVGMTAPHVSVSGPCRIENGVKTWYRVCASRWRALYTCGPLRRRLWSRD